MAGSLTPYTQVDPSTVLGNLRFIAGVLDATDGAGAVIPTGLDTVLGASLIPKSVNTSGGIKIALSSGNLIPATCTSGDTWFCTVYGK